MNTTIKSLAMVAIALFAGFGSASAQEESTDEGVELTKDMYGMVSQEMHNQLMRMFMWTGMWVQRSQLVELFVVMAMLRKHCMPTCLPIITW